MKHGKKAKSEQGENEALPHSCETERVSRKYIPRKAGKSGTTPASPENSMYTLTDSEWAATVKKRDYGALIRHCIVNINAGAQITAGGGFHLTGHRSTQ